MRPRLVLSTLFVLAGSAAAQQKQPACTATQHRQFDFWLGDWTVTDSTGTSTLGTNSITREEGGCLVHEHWTDADGSTGPLMEGITDCGSTCPKMLFAVARLDCQSESSRGR